MCGHMASLNVVVGILPVLAGGSGQWLFFLWWRKKKRGRGERRELAISAMSSWSMDVVSGLGSGFVQSVENWGSIYVVFWGQKWGKWGGKWKVVSWKVKNRFSKYKINYLYSILELSNDVQYNALCFEGREKNWSSWSQRRVVAGSFIKVFILSLIIKRWCWAGVDMRYYV